ncbi:hypothetical protein MHBO_003962 [Bonamia ostreae]|uniref:Uncharacterized protein n=1 Tax=Bonamia ostreae TaxID=126728 RepID=A0ABV2AST6_9EUKA
MDDLSTKIEKNGNFKPRRTREFYRRTQGPQYLCDLPDRIKFSHLFFGTNETDHVNAHSHDSNFYSELEFLTSPLRKKGPVDDWSVKEIALFEIGIFLNRKNFSTIQKMCC